jgi:hypothetical protein
MTCLLLNDIPLFKYFMGCSHVLAVIQHEIVIIIALLMSITRKQNTLHLNEHSKLGVNDRI